MKSLKLSIILIGAFAAASVLTAVAIQRQAQKNDLRSPAAATQRYQVRGEIRGMEGATVRIKHEEIPGYMAAMTMPFEIRNASMLRGLRVGDEIGFELSVTDNDSWISRIDKISAAPAADSSEASTATAKELQRVQTGEKVPDFLLTDQNGKPVRLSDYHGKAVLLTFIYTRCPLPNYCPLMSKNFASLQERLEKEFPGKFQLLSVSIDPEFDRPEVLKGYASRFSSHDVTWTFGTGTAEQTDAVGALFGLV
jgi:protein SCO1